MTRDTLSVAELRKITSKLSVPDRQILWKAGLAAMDPKYIAFQTIFGDRSFCVLVSRSVRPSQICKLDDDEMGRYVIVLERLGKRGWAKRWPSDDTA